METIKAYDFLKSRGCIVSNAGLQYVTVQDVVEFAKIHVELALKEASRTRLNGFYHASDEINKILNAYPLSNIK